MCALLMSHSDTDGKMLNVVVCFRGFFFYSSPINQHGLLFTTARRSRIRRKKKKKKTLASEHSECFISGLHATASLSYTKPLVFYHPAGGSVVPNPLHVLEKHFHL